MSSMAPAADNVDSPPSSDGEDPAGAQANSSDQWVTRCICVNNSQVEGFMIECERCQVWQHGDCVRVDKGKVPDEYFCELCRPELHDARGLWTGGVRSQQAGKVAVNRSSSKKKKTKSRKQSSQGANSSAAAAAAAAGNGVGEGSSDNAMIDVRGTSAQPDPHPPGVAGPDPPTNTMDDDQRNLSREERKIVKIMQTIQMMEDRDKKRRRSGSANATPDQQGSGNRGQSTDEQTSKRRKSRPTSASKPAASFDVPMLSIGGYDVDQLKSSPALLRNLFPVSPMYLGSKVFLLQQVALMEHASNGTMSLPGTPAIHIKERLCEALNHAKSSDTLRSLRDDRRTCRSPSPRPDPSNQSVNSSPFSSQPLSPAVAVAPPESPGNVSNAVPSMVKVETRIHEVSAKAAAPTESDAVPVLNTTDGVVDGSNAKSNLSSIPRLSTIPKLSASSGRSSESVSAPAPVLVISKPGVFNPMPIPPIAVSGAVTPLSSLSELMQSYMNAPPTEFAPPGPLDLTRYKVVNPGGVLPPPSVPLVPPRWTLDPNSSAPPIPLPSSRFIPPVSFRRTVAPPSSTSQTNNQQSHPS